MDVKGLAREFKQHFGSAPQIFSAPGRVNLIGEHTDYNEGFVLPFAIDLRTFGAYSPRTDGTLNLHSRTLGESIDITLGRPNREKGWWTYIEGMAEVLTDKGYSVSGANILIDSEIPFGAGLSSSAALEVAAGFAMMTASNDSVDRVELALAGQRVEHEFIGVRSGIMDQFTSALAAVDHALLIDCRSLSFDSIPMELGDLSIVVCDSKVKHELADSAYNERREQCEAGVEVIRQRYPHVRALRDVKVSQLDALSDALPDVIAKRCRHVVTENDRTLKAADALRERNFKQVGELMFGSHESLRDDYEVSCEELDVLVESARGASGVVGSRMTGGGFGGCTVSLVKTERLKGFVDLVSADFRKRFDQECEIFPVKPSEGARMEVFAPNG